MQIKEKSAGETSKEYALRMLKDNIVKLELAPGSVVSANALALELGLSKTPVREALMELSKTHIVEIQPQKGCVISLIDLDLVEESQFLRVVLETAVVERVCEIATEENLAYLSGNISLQEFYLKSSNAGKLLEMDDDFHKTLFLIAKKEHIFELMNSMTAHFDRVRTLSLKAVKDIKIVQDHRDILAAIQNRNKEEAVAAMKKHLTRYKLDENEIISKHGGYFNMRNRDAQA